MSTDTHITTDDLILLALQFLPEAELPQAQKHLADCPECRDELGRLQGDLAAYAWGVEQHTPPAYGRERLLRRIALDKKQMTARHGAAAAGQNFSNSDIHLVPTRRSRVIQWAGWAVAAGMAAVAVLQFAERQHSDNLLEAQQRQIGQSARAQDVLQTLTDSRAKQVGIHLASATEAQKTPEAHAAYRADTGALVFFASNLQPLQAYKTYELWLIPANGHEPIAAGLFKPDASGNANVLMPNLPKGIAASGFGVTIEDEAGAKQPTLPIIMTGA